MKLQLIGGGKMGQALAGGLLSSGWLRPEELTIVEVVAELRAALETLFPGVKVAEVPLPEVDTILAVKPWSIVEVAAGLVRPGRVLSIAAGVTLGTIEAALPTGTPVIRSMPNTPALLAAGASALAGGASATEADLDWATQILAAVGQVVVVTESQIDAVTGLSGSGPAYFFLVGEALADAGVAVGLPRATAELLAYQTMLGSARMLLESGDPASVLRAGVTTPAGTTAAGTSQLERHGVRAAMIAAVEAATDRSRELGRPAT
ncbi:MAG: pyrroline-5-carboxylate reductase [Actinomycetota bacterium]|nr:pyrroline-5-carboxylate reductase [Actinomycetota bacterium]